MLHIFFFKKNLQIFESWNLWLDQSQGTDKSQIDHLLANQNQGTATSQFELKVNILDFAGGGIPENNPRSKG